MSVLTLGPSLLPSVSGLEKVQGATRLGATGLRASERKSASERVSERTSENLSKDSENLSKISENLWKPLKTSETLSKPLKTSKNLSKPLKNLWKPSLSETLSEADFLSEALSPVAPILLPLKLSPTGAEGPEGFSHQIFRYTPITLALFIISEL